MNIMGRKLTDRPRRAVIEGQSAFRRGRSINDNPYKGYPMTRWLARCWSHGFSTAV